ncbi:MAG TPA: ankyrin repeat domain-containing protein, partial [Acidobacteriota bacterium]|nr:ankyrin repeat domain-containing protein [Acidobacteriota bacterium]
MSLVKMLLLVCLTLGWGSLEAADTAKLNDQLLQAAKKGNAASVHEALQAGASVNATDKKLRTPLMVAADEGHADVVTELLQAGADPNLQD